VDRPQLPFPRPYARLSIGAKAFDNFTRYSASKTCRRKMTSSSTSSGFKNSLTLPSSVLGFGFGFGPRGFFLGSKADAFRILNEHSFSEVSNVLLVVRSGFRRKSSFSARAYTAKP
jgi:hypothetical protein